MLRTSLVILLSALLFQPVFGEDTSVRPYKIAVRDEVLEDLNERLDRTRFPDQIQNAGWSYGTDINYLKELVAYWRTQYDWPKHEAQLNAFDQFITEIDGVDVHFIHQRSKVENALPIIITHGWPGSVCEFVDIIGPLTDPEAFGGSARDAFHVICPSMPGFGFSGIPDQSGYSVARMGETMAKLMARLEYDRYAAQGGDWGASVTAWLGEKDADHLVGIHLTLPRSGPGQGVTDPFAGVPAWEIQRREAREKELEDHWAYSQIQGTRPQALGYALNDSPVGLAGWIVDKYYAWSDCQGNIENAFTKDQLLTNIMIYWTTGTITSSTRIYYETRLDNWNRGYIGVPTAVAVFPKEIRIPIRSWVEQGYNVQQWTEMPRGGHFAALEEPELLVEDIRKFFRIFRQ
ncbi:MAG: alpha/beta hydrolase [Verrucomicrobiae bacterium]|nr:alpha/beta hydrolase [Verrucomicrobiae bacterium]